MNNKESIDNHNKKALVIAVSDYDNSSGLKSIEYCKNDGQEMYNVLKKLGYDIPDNRKLIGYVDSKRLRDAVYDFFTNEDTKPDDTLVFYYSGHGVPDKWGKTFLAPSEMDANHPFKTGFSFDDLTDSMLGSNSLSVVTILDSCFSGSLKIGKGIDSKSGEEAATRIANKIVEEKSDKLKQGVGRCLLAASQGYEEAYDRQEKDHSIFTYYLLEGLKGHKNAVDEDGNVTYDTLGKFITREMGNLPAEKRPKQTPIRKGEVSGGEIVLGNYPAFVTNIKSIDSMINEGIQYYENYEYNKARILFDKALEINPTNTLLYNYKGDSFFKEKNYYEAIRWYDEALKINPDYLDVLKDKGLCLIKLKKYDEALGCFNTILNTTSNNTVYWDYKGSILSNLEKYDEAIKCYERIVDIEPNDVDAWRKKADIYYKLKQYEESLKCHKQIVSLDPDNSYSKSMIDILLKQLGGTTITKAELDEFNVLMKEGSELSWQKRFKQALKKFEDAIKINPNSSYAVSKKSSVLLQMNDYKKALDATNDALNLDASNIEALFNKGYILAGAGRYEEAIEWYDKTTDLDFKNANAWYQKGNCYERIGMKQDAKNCYKIAEDLKIG